MPLLHRRRYFYHPLAFRATLILFAIQFSSVQAGELLNAPITTLYVPRNAEPQDEILADLPLRVNEGDEDVALSLDPPSDTIAVSPSIASSNTPIHLLVIDPQKLRNRGGEKLKLQALGLITGKEEQLTVEVKVDSEASRNPGNGVVMPPFEKDEYELQLEHNFLEREIAIVKMKSEPPPQTRFELIGPLSERFTVTREGQLVYLTATPCETRCTTPKTFAVLLVATAKDGSSQQIATLGFRTADEDKLRFLNAPYHAIVEEETGVFERALKVITTGATGEVMYSLQDISGLFSIHPKTGILMVLHPEFLTRSSYGSVINMTVTVTDKKSSTTTPIRVTVRPAAEHLKAFKFVEDSYTFTVPPGVTLVGMVVLTGAENHTIQFGIAEGSQGVLSIDEQGVLYYHREPEKESRNFTVLVTARSTEGQFFVATTWVEVLVEGIHSNPLRIKGPIRRSAVIGADTKRGSKLATIDLSDEDDDATVQVSVDAVSGVCLNGTEVKGLPTEMFRVKMTGQQAELSLAEPLSELPLATIAVQLSAQDLAHLSEPHVKVTQHLVLVRTKRMVTEKPLPFKFVKVPKMIEIPPNTPEGSVVYRPALLQSIISNSSEFIYDIESSSEAFTIDNKTGIITTNRRFDDSLEDVITVTVTDPVTERSAQVNITVSVAEPAVRETIFSERQYSGSVRKTDPPGTVVASVSAKTDRDQAVKAYSLEGKDATFFTIDDKGSILLKDSISEVPRSELNFVVRASAAEISSTAPVHIVVSLSDDDVELAFEKSSYSVKVMENLPLNGYVLHPKLIKGDAPHVDYSIETLNEATVIKDLLDIDSDGRITIKEELQGHVGTYDFQVRAAKGERRASADVHLEVLAAYRCLPLFLGEKNFEFTVEENSPVGTTIGTVSAAKLDEKCELKFHLWDPTTHKYTNQTTIASIDVENGQIRSRAIFDYEDTPIFPLVLGLQAGAHQFVQLASNIRVLDVDDHPLHAVLEAVTVEVPEDVAVGTVVATMRATDLDKSQKVFYRLREESREFAVNSTTGEVSVMSSLDRETKDSYSLEVGASNEENADVNRITVWMSLQVRVKDVNDNGPLFEQSQYHVLVAKDTLPGEAIVTVAASDPDVPSPGNDMTEVFYRVKETAFEYHGMSRQVQGVFSVNATTGVVTLDQVISDYVGGVFNLVLESMDGMASDAHKDQTVVRVYVHDEYDIVRMDLAMAPAAVTYEKVEAISKTIADATGLKVLVKDLQYHHEEGKLIYDVTDLRLVLINRTTSEIIPAERAIAIADKHRAGMGDQMPSMTKAQITSSPVVHQGVPPLAYVLSVFALSLTLIFLIFGLMMCHYRNRFRREKKLQEDDNVITKALNRPPVRPPIQISRMLPTRSFGPHIPAVDGNYAVQEMKMVVGGDDERRPARPW